jgi:hypothetical protein
MTAGRLDFLSGESGHVGGVRAKTRAILRDRTLDARLALGAAGRAARSAAGPPRRVMITSIYGSDSTRVVPCVEELRRTRHDVEFALGARGDVLAPLQDVTVAANLPGGKFENVNSVLEGRDPAGRDWFLVVDDDVVLPRHFLDRFIAICEALDFALAQPAQTWGSHAAWRITRRRGGSVARETRFVEIGPVTAFRADATASLVPFPPLRYGWGLDVHWAALAREHGWKLGIVDALPVQHATRPAGARYSFAGAVLEGREFLRDRPYVPATEAQQTVVRHARLPR